jgi:hypothetical protein
LPPMPEVVLGGGARTPRSQLSLRPGEWINVVGWLEASDMPGTVSGMDAGRGQKPLSLGFQEWTSEKVQGPAAWTMRRADTRSRSQMGMRRRPTRCWIASTSRWRADRLREQCVAAISEWVGELWASLGSLRENTPKAVQTRARARLCSSTHGQLGRRGHPRYSPKTDISHRPTHSSDYHVAPEHAHT